MTDDTNPDDLDLVRRARAMAKEILATLGTMKRARAMAKEISATLGTMKDAIDRGDTDLTAATSAAPFREYAALLREWADEIGRFDPAEDAEE